MATDIRIYVACLSSYNAGDLHGRWIDATLGAEHIREEVAAMLAESKHEPHEEWAIHDHEGFGEAKPSEQESFDTVAAWAEGIEKHGEAFGAFVSWRGDDSTVEQFEDAYRGTFRTIEDYAEQLIDDCYDTKAMGALANYIDYEKFARDLQYGGDIYTTSGGDGVYVFDNNV